MCQKWGVTNNNRVLNWCIQVRGLPSFVGRIHSLLTTNDVAFGNGKIHDQYIQSGVSELCGWSPKIFSANSMGTRKDMEANSEQLSLSIKSKWLKMYPGIPCIGYYGVIFFSDAYWSFPRAPYLFILFITASFGMREKHRPVLLKITTMMVMSEWGKYNNPYKCIFHGNTGSYPSRISHRS